MSLVRSYFRRKHPLTLDEEQFHGTVYVGTHAQSSVAPERPPVRKIVSPRWLLVDQAGLCCPQECCGSCGKESSASALAELSDTSLVLVAPPCCGCRLHRCIEDSSQRGIQHARLPGLIYSRTPLTMTSSSSARHVARQQGRALEMNTCAKWPSCRFVQQSQCASLDFASLGNLGKSHYILDGNEGSCQ